MSTDIEDLEAPKKRGGGKPAGKWGKLTDDQLFALYRMHRDRGLSVRELGRKLHAGGKYGFASPKSAAMSMSSGWKRLELPALSRIESTIRASRKHGFLPRRGRRPGAKRNAREWREANL